MRRAAIIAGGVLLLAGCGGSNSEGDDATDYARVACGIETQTDGTVTYRGIDEEGGLTWDAPIGELQTRADTAKSRAVAAASAKNLSASWLALADATSIDSAFWSRLVKWRLDNAAGSLELLLVQWPTVMEDGVEANAAGDRVDTECAALTERLSG